ncbi:MAG: DUF58 domain-containing protein [Phycisphaerales bacterium]
MRLSRRYRPRASSLLFVGVTAFLGIGAIQQDPNLLPLVFGVAISVVIISGVVGGGMLMGVRPKRLGVAPAQVGVAYRVRYEVRSAARLLPSFALQIAEQRSPRRTPESERWERFFSMEDGAGRAFIAQIGPRERVRSIGRLTPIRRGVCVLRGVEVGSGFPFGLFYKLVIAHQPARLLVRPRVHTLRSGAMPVLMSRMGREAQTDRKRRVGDEFFALREYMPGDSPRFVAWRTSARLGTLVVREHADRSSRRVRLVLLVAPEASHDDAERAIELFASLASGLVRTDVALHVDIPQAGTRYDDARPAAIEQVLDTLALFDAAQAPPASLPASRDAVLIVRTDEAAGLPAPPAGALVYTSNDLERLTVMQEASA